MTTAIARGTYLLAPKGLHLDLVTKIGAKRVDLTWSPRQPAMRVPRGNVDRDIARGRFTVLTADQADEWRAQRRAISTELGSPNSWDKAWGAYVAAVSAMSTTLIAGLAA